MYNRVNYMRGYSRVLYYVLVLTCAIWDGNIYVCGCVGCGEADVVFPLSYAGNCTYASPRPLLVSIRKMTEVRWPKRNVLISDGVKLCRPLAPCELVSRSFGLSCSVSFFFCPSITSIFLLSLFSFDSSLFFFRSISFSIYFSNMIAFLSTPFVPLPTTCMFLLKSFHSLSHSIIRSIIV